MRKIPVPDYPSLLLGFFLKYSSNSYLPYEKKYKKVIGHGLNKEELERIILCDVQNEIYPDLEKIFLNVIKDSGFPDLKLEKKVDFEKLYQQRLN